MKHLDLFSGIGGFALAASWVWGAEHEIVSFCEIEPFAQKVLKKHWPDVPIINNVKELTWGKLAQIAKQQSALQTEKQVDSCPIANHAKTSGKQNGESKTSKEKTNQIGNGAEKRKTKSSSITVDGVSVVEKQQKNFSASTIKKTTVIQKERNTNPKHGNSQSSEDCQTITKSSATIATTLSQITESAPTKEGVQIDLLTAGTPCQPASCAGKQRGTEDSRWLWPETFRVIRELRPGWCILENVRGLLSLEQGVVFDSLLSELEAMQYEVFSFIIPACGVDAPHRRDRVWIVANNDRQRQQEQRDEITNEQKNSSVKLRGKVNSNPISEHDDIPGYGTGEVRRERSEKAEIQGCSLADNVEQQRDGGRDGVGRGQWKPREIIQDVGKRGRQENGVWLPEPAVGRVANGVPGRVDRLKGLGNAIVPQVVVPIMQAIKDLNN